MQSNTLLLADNFEIFYNKRIKIYEFDPVQFLRVPELAWQACFKKTEMKFELLTNNDMLQTVDKIIRGETFHAIYQYAEANNWYKKDYNKNKELSYLMYWDVNSFYESVISQILHVDRFELGKSHQTLMKVL